MVDAYQLQQRSGTTQGGPETMISFRRPLGVAAVLLAAWTSMPSLRDSQEILRLQNVYHIERQGTVGQTSATTYKPDQRESDCFEASIARFYAQLLSGQEPLGAEFEKVLHDNLWDLYART